MARREVRGNERHCSFFRSAKSSSFSTRRVVARRENMRRGSAIIGNRFLVHAKKAEIISFREIDSPPPAILSYTCFHASRHLLSSHVCDRMRLIERNPDFDRSNVFYLAILFLREGCLPRERKGDSIILFLSLETWIVPASTLIFDFHSDIMLMGMGVTRRYWKSISRSSAFKHLRLDRYMMDT
jgi:hypothetical protein